MAQNNYRGTEVDNEISASAVRPDTRRLGRRASNWFETTDGVIGMMMIFSIVALFMLPLPMTGELIVLSMWLFHTLYVKINPKKVYDFPYRVPTSAKLLDGSSTNISLGKGITFLGREISSKLEIWTGASDLTTHLLVLGTTGSGKTELLLGLVYNALVQNSGFIYTDGKGSVDLWENVFRLTRYLGREDDLLLISFLTSGRDFLEKQADRTTNTMNPFALGSSGMVIELIISLMDDSGGGGDMWKGRAIAFVAGLTRALCYLRDRGYFLLDANTFVQYFELPVIERMVWDKTIVIDGQDRLINEPLFEKVLEPLKSFILTLPGYKRESKGQQEQKTVEQHGFIVMQLTRLFGDMSFTYGYLFQTPLGEVDMFDVVINRRILVVLLPALERAPDSLRMLGKIIVGAIKQMMAGCLGNRVEGMVREIVMARPTYNPIPYYVVLDEYGYYAVLGFAVAPAQARSLNFSITFAAQDFSSLQKASKEEADATWENTNVRAVGRITGGKEAETFKRIDGVGGEVSVYETERKEHNSGALFDGFSTIRDAVLRSVRRISYDDLAQQENGEFTFLVGKKKGGGVGGVRVIRARTFYTAVSRSEMPRETRLNHLLKVEPPRSRDEDDEIDIEVIESLEVALKNMMVSGVLAKVFPDDPTEMVKNKHPIALYQMKLFVEQIQSTQQLPLREAMRSALTCLERFSDVSQANSMKVIEQLSKAKVTAENTALALSVTTLLESDVDPGEAVREKKDEGEGEGEGEGKAGDGAKSSGGSSGGAMSLDLMHVPMMMDDEDSVPNDQPTVATDIAEVSPIISMDMGEMVRNTLNDYDFGESASVEDESGTAASESEVPVIGISVLTLRSLGKDPAIDESDEFASYAITGEITRNSMIAVMEHVEVAIGSSHDTLKIKRNVEAAVDLAEKAVVYYGNIEQPPAATVESLDDALREIKKGLEEKGAAKTNLDLS